MTDLGTNFQDWIKQVEQKLKDAGNSPEDIKKFVDDLKNQPKAFLDAIEERVKQAVIMAAICLVCAAVGILIFKYAWSKLFPDEAAQLRAMQMAAMRQGLSAITGPVQRVQEPQFQQQMVGAATGNPVGLFPR